MQTENTMPNINNTDNEQKHNAERIIKSTWAKVAKLVKYKTHSLDLSKDAEDIPAEAIEFAYKDKRIAWEDIPSAEKHLFRVARKVAKWRICTEIKKAKRAIVSYELDMLEEGEDGEPLENHKAEAKHLMELYREERCHKKMMKKGRMALARLDGFLAVNGVSPRDISIFRDRVLHDMPTDVVCNKHKVTPNNLYKIVCVVRQIIATNGRSLLRE